MKLCDYCGSDKQVRNYRGTGIFVCGKHYMQLKRGEIKRTKFDSNVFKISKNHNIVLMKIYDKYGNYKAKTIFDLKHLEKINQYKWCLGDKGNILSCINGKMVKLHRFVLGAETGETVKHISKNLLNNLESNLIIIRKGDKK